MSKRPADVAAAARAKLAQKRAKLDAATQDAPSPGLRVELHPALREPGKAEPAERVNPYFDPTLAGHGGRGRGRGRRAFQFNDRGKFVELAERKREEERARQLRARISVGARKAGIEDDLNLSGRQLQPPPPPDVEWWDKPLVGEAYPKHKDELDRILGDAGTAVTRAVQHPVPIFDEIEVVPVVVKYTRTEQKKLRRQERAANMKDKQDKQRLGLMEPDAPKVKLSNMMRVVGDAAVQDPTKVEKAILAQVKERRDTHERNNAERALSHEEKQAKARQQLEEDAARGIRCCAWRVDNMANGYHRRRLEDNANQCAITGVVLLNPRFNLVYAEGGAKAIKFYKHLVESRITWTEAPRAGTHADDDFSRNRCTCVWEGDLPGRLYRNFIFKKAETEAEVREALSKYDASPYSLWQAAKRAGDE
ncbi:U4/U5/U6 small nuclear ribonucleoprotein prp3 [Savitreella phatthalungensis]